MIEFVLELECIGLHNPTTVRHENRILTTQGLDIETLSNLWKWYFHIPSYYKIVLEMSSRDFRATQQRSLPGIKNVQELFYEQGIVCKEKKDEVHIQE